MSYFDWEHGFCAMDQKKGVSWVAALGVVRRLQSTEGSSSTQACLAFSRGADGGTVMMKPENLIAFDGARKIVGL
jgi:hypothetical protein